MLTTGMFVADRYEIEEKIGAGGMSDVYKARDHILGRNVAIKVLKQEFSEDVNFVSKFRTEAQSAAGLEHPNIVNIYDVGSESGIHYIVMEYVEGVTLKTYIEKKLHLTYKEAVSIAIQVGRGIEAAHAKHIIHRDIKPQNILISTEGKAKVTDFGIARAVSSNTISADVMGSVHYASPEQARNGFVDGKSDIYSLGIVMYEMVTGRVPFDGETTVAVAIQHLQEDMVPPRTYAPDLPISLEKIILKCTQKSPDRRYENMGELLEDLKKVLINPNEDFVSFASGAGQAKTRVIGEDEVNQIRNARNVTPQDDEEEIRRENARKEALRREAARREALARKEADKKAQAYNDEDEEDDDEEGFLNPSMEKAVTIGGIVAALIIIGIIVYLVSHVFLGGSSGKKDDKKNETEVSTQVEDEDTIEMIDVRGMTYEEAKEKLNAMNLGIHEAGTQNSDTYAKGQIMSQDIEAGTKVEKNQTLNVYISSGGSTQTPATGISAPVPNVVGMDSATAMSTLQAAGFTVETTMVSSETVETGKVIAQSPQGDTTATTGDKVVITVSQGQDAATASCVVPDVYNRSQEEAKTLLTNAGLNVSSITSDYSTTVPAGNVISQSIAQGSQVQQGTSISLVVSLGTQSNKYYCKATISAPSSAAVQSADITLLDASGNQLQGWSGISIESFPYTIFVSDIESSSSGTLCMVWHLSDGSIREQRENVAFTKQ